MAERLLILCNPQEEVIKLLKRTIENRLPYEGSELSVENVKLSGPTINLGNNVIISYEDESSMKYVIEMKGNEIYDGLGFNKKAGDRAFTEKARRILYARVLKKEGDYLSGGYLDASKRPDSLKYAHAVILFQNPNLKKEMKLRYACILD